MCPRRGVSSVGGVIEVQEATKYYGGTAAVRDVSFTVVAGRVTGFLGPNGSGKSTTMRMILALDRPTRGRVLVAGRPYRDLTEPLRTVGALLEAGNAHGGRRARDHLAMLAACNGIARRRVDEVLELVGLASVAQRRVRGFSLGMLQRLGIAGALLGDPAVLILDEPMNGLDTEGIRWLRQLLIEMAAQGRTVLLSSHVMSEMELTADHLLVIGGGRLLADEPMSEFIGRHSPEVVRVGSGDNTRLAAALARAGTLVETGRDRLLVHRTPAQQIGAVAVEIGVVINELTTQRASLEEVYTAMVTPHGQYRQQSTAEVA